MDMKEQIEKMVNRIAKDDSLKAQFLENPIKIVENILGKDLPDEIVEKIIDGVKAKLTVDSIGGALGNLKKLF